MTLIPIRVFVGKNNSELTGPDDGTPESALYKNLALRNWILRSVVTKGEHADRSNRDFRFHVEKSLVTWTSHSVMYVIWIDEDRRERELTISACMWQPLEPTRIAPSVLVRLGN